MFAAGHAVILILGWAIGIDEKARQCDLFARRLHRARYGGFNSRIFGRASLILLSGIETGAQEQTGARKGDWGPRRGTGGPFGEKGGRPKRSTRANVQIVFLRRERARGEVFQRRGSKQQGKGASLSPSPWPSALGKIRRVINLWEYLKVGTA